MQKKQQDLFELLKKLRSDLYTKIGSDNNDIVAAVLLFVLVHANSNCTDKEKAWARKLYDLFGVENHYSIHIDDIVTRSIALLSSIDKDVFSETYADAIEWIFEGFVEKHYGQFSQPIDVTMLVERIVERYAITSLYNPFAGLGCYASIAKLAHYYGQEKSEVVYLFGKIWQKANGYKTSGYKIGDSVQQWNDHEADCIISTPPFGADMAITPSGKRTDLGTYLINKFINGHATYAIYVIPTGLCSTLNNGAFDTRNAILETNALEMVIELPKGEFFPASGISTSMIVLNKYRKSDEPVLFVDASNLCLSNAAPNAKVIDVDSVIQIVNAKENSKDSVLVSVDEIRELDNNWQASYHIAYKNEVFPDGYTVLKLNNVLEPIRRGKSFMGEKGRLVRIADLPNETGVYQRTPEDFKMQESLPLCYKVEEPALLLSTIGVLKPTYCVASPENPIYLHPHVVAYRVCHDWVNPIYLCLEISRRKAPVSGMVIPSINKRQIGHIRVAFPSLNSQNSIIEQELLYKEYIEGNKIAKAKEFGLHEIISKLKSEYMIEVRNRKHDMKTPMTQLRNTLTLMEAFANRLPDESSAQLQVYIGRQKLALDTLSEIVRHLADEDVFSEPEELDVKSILASFNETNDNYSIVFIPDSIALNEVAKGKNTIFIGKSDFLRLVNNIISNAITHGFVDKSLHYRLQITLSVEDGFYIIDFTNNGRPLPDGMDKARYGMRGVKGKDSDGQGTGGYVVKSIVEHYGGNYNIFTKDRGGQKYTSVVVKLPIYRGDE